MTLPHDVKWIRLCVDVEPSGMVVGASYELHDDDGQQTFGMVPYGPFDDLHEALDGARLYVLERYGQQLRLL